MPIANIFPQFTQPGAELAKLPEEIQDIRLKAAKANLPFGGTIPPGPAGQTVGLEMVKNLYGPDSPQYKQAKAMYDLEQRSTTSRVNYQDVLAGSANKRFSTPLAKTGMEYEDIKRGFYPGTTTPISEEDKEKYQGLYGLKFLKETTDQDTRKRNLFAHNMDITISQIDPKALTQYSGPEGIGNLLKDRADSLSGKDVPRYKAYEDAVTAAKTLAKQYRQYAGDSITPGVQNDLKTLTNPTSWMLHPDIAMQKYNKFINLLKSETGTYQQATQNPDIYSGSAGVPNQNQPPQQPPQQAQQPSQAPQDGQYSPQVLSSQAAAQNEGLANVPALQANGAVGTSLGGNNETVRVRNKKTGVIEEITKQEARKRGVPGV